MTDMQIAVRFRRKAGGNFAVVFIECQVIGDNMPDKVVCDRLIFSARH